MLFLVAILAAAYGTTPPVARTPAPPAKATHSCLPQGLTFAQQTNPIRGLRRLGDEPPASQYLAVERQVGGCPAPAVVRTGIGR